MSSSRIILVLLTVLFLSACVSKDRDAQPTPPAGFEIEPGFHLELIASEPLISDPVDMEIDESGRLFVVEMHGYPLDKSGTGKIKILIDTDKDGVFDKSEVFVEGLVLPNSIMRWKNGFIVTDAPHVLYFEDTDNDNHADKSDTLLTGFALSNPQHNLNSPLLGIDNWIYLAHEGAVGTETYKEDFGDRGGEIFEPGYTGTRLAVNAGGRSVRFQPDRHTLEMTSSHSQFGHTFDRWGHHLQVGNANHIYQEVLAERYLKRNPGLLLSDATESLSDHGEAAEVFPITKNPEHQLLTDIGVITSACGIHAYQGGLLPAPYDQAVFVAEPVSNLVHVDRLSGNGSLDKASRLQPHREFLASEDPKFRPVNLYTGPDGALYVVDYYRQIIEHPEWMGDDVVKSGALYNDTDKGRIYRITPDKSPEPTWIKGLTLGAMPDDSLVEKLASENAWWSANAQRLLVDRNNQGILGSLTNMAANPASSTGRLRALWTLQGMNAINEETLKIALADSVAGIRENAIQIAELNLDKYPRLTETMLSMTNDKDPKVRLQLLSTLGSIQSDAAAAARQSLLLHDLDDTWIQFAALTAPQEQVRKLLPVILEKYDVANRSYSSLASKLTQMMGSSGKDSELHDLFQRVFRASLSPWRADVLRGIGAGLEERRTTFALNADEQEKLVTLLFSDPAASVNQAALGILKITGIQNESVSRRSRQESMLMAEDEKFTEGKRSVAIDFLGLEGSKAHRDLWKKLINPSEPLPVQLAALRSFSNIPDTEVSQFLIDQWPVLTPELRDAGIQSFLENEKRVAMLLSAIESKKIGTSEVSWPRKVGLMAQRNIPLRTKARSLFTASAVSQASYKEILERDGSEEKGIEVFQTQCSLCHQIRGKGGIKLGPDLGTVHNWSKKALVENIMTPSQSISSGFELWSIELNNGEKLQGIIESETPGVIALVNTGNWKKAIKRSDIKSISALNLSVMPDDFGTKLSGEQMSDLVAYLKANK